MRAMVAFACRCARRTEPLAQLPEAHPQHESRRAAVASALVLAERFASGDACPDADAVVQAVEATRGATDAPWGSEIATGAVVAAAHAVVLGRSAFDLAQLEASRGPGKESKEERESVALLTHEAVDVAALDAFTAAAEAYAAIGYDNDSFVASALNDYERLLRLELGHYPQLGAPVDLSPQGPLGML